MRFVLLFLCGVVLSGNAKANCAIPFGKPVINEAKAIFIGKVAKNKSVSESDDFFDHYNNITTFEVLQPIKGIAQDSLNVFYHDGVRKTSDGRVSIESVAVSPQLFSEGMEYFIFTKYDENSKRHYFSGCGINIINMERLFEGKLNYESVITIYAILDMFPELRVTDELALASDQLFPILEKNAIYLCEEKDDIEKLYTTRVLKVCD